ncbi:hypothetical protein EDD22DRAFT_960911 [Suillus occidentalis]|nr:hypothetical protein EDD22DRAFT_960911 [Suillus occidentalis]
MTQLKRVPECLADSKDEENSSPPQPTATRAPLLSLISQIPQAEMTESIYSVTPLPSQFPYSTQSPEPCGKIRVGEKIYTIKRILFATRGLVGRGTVCYLVTLDDDEDYIIKDHWVLGKDDNVVLNEIKMLELMDNVPGVPRLVDYWVVETDSDGELTLPANIGHKERGVPEAPVVLNSYNAMILDELGSSEGFLIDWEFAVRIAADNKYPIGGTGTVPFMSCGLLNQVAILQQQANLELMKKKTWAHKSMKKPTTPTSSLDSLALPISFVVHRFADDLESLFFIFTWVCIKFSGPNGMVCQGPLPNSLLDQWTSLDLEACAAFKITFFANPAEEKHLTDEFHPYFRDLIPLATEWRKARVDNMIHPVTFSTILGILNSHLNKLPDNEELATTVNMLKNDAAVLADCFKGKWLASESFSVVEPKRQKSHHTGDTESDSALGSDT